MGAQCRGLPENTSGLPELGFSGSLARHLIVKRKCRDYCEYFAQNEARGRENRHAHLLRSQLCRADGCGGGGYAAGGRFAGHDGAGAEIHPAGEPGRYVLPHGGSGVRQQQCADRERFAVWCLPAEQGAGFCRCGRTDGGRGAYGEAGRRRLDGGNHRVSTAARHSGVRAHRAHAAVGACVRRL